MKQGYLEDKVFCSATEFNEFGHKVAEFSGQHEDIDHVMNNDRFTGGEFCPKFKESVKDKTVYISATPDHNIGPQAMHMRICLAADAAKQDGAKEVVLIQPLLAYSRQDRSSTDDKKLKGQPFSIRVQARNFHANGIDKILTMHLHSRANYYPYAEVFFKNELNEFKKTSPSVEELDDKKVELGRKVMYNLNPNPIFGHYLRFNSSLAIDNADNKDWLGKDVVFISPDLGAKYHIYDLQDMSFLTDSSYCNCLKVRGEPNNPHDLQIDLDTFSDNFFTNGGLEGKILVVSDDMVDTGGTIHKTCLALMNNNEYGTPKGIILAFTHPILAGDQYKSKQQLLGSMKPQEILTTNTLPYIETKRNPGWKKYSSVLRIAHYVSDAIKNCVEPGVNPHDFYVYKNLDELQTVSSLYDMKDSTLHFMRGRKR